MLADNGDNLGLLLGRDSASNDDTRLAGQLDKFFEQFLFPECGYLCKLLSSNHSGCVSRKANFFLLGYEITDLAIQAFS